MGFARACHARQDTLVAEGEPRIGIGPQGPLGEGPLVQKTCESCGHLLEDSAIFCPECGALQESGPAWSVLLMFVPVLLIMGIFLVLMIFG